MAEPVQALISSIYSTVGIAKRDPDGNAGRAISTAAVVLEFGGLAKQGRGPLHFACFVHTVNPGGKPTPLSYATRLPEWAYLS